MELTLLRVVVTWVSLVLSDTDEVADLLLRRYKWVLQVKLEKQTLCQTRLTFSKSTSCSLSIASRYFVQLRDTRVAGEFRCVSTSACVAWRSGHPPR